MDDPISGNIYNPFTPSTNTDPNTNMDSAVVNPVYSQIPDQNNVDPQATETYPQDQRIVDYLIQQVIPAKFPDMTADKVVIEKDRLYKILESGIFDTAYQQLAEDQKNELDSLMKYGADIPAIQAFFIEKIPNIQIQLGKYMEEFVQKYLKGEI